MLYTRKVPGAPSSLKLGGIAIYGKSHDQIYSAITNLEREIDAELKSHICLSAQGFRIKLLNKIDAEKPQRVLSAVFGRFLSQGNADVFVCESALGARYRTFAHIERRDRFYGALIRILGACAARETYTVREIRNCLFETDEWGSWSMSAMLVDRLAAIGLVKHLD